MNQLRQHAEEFFSETNILTHLKNHGHPCVHGSFDLDFMVWPELDILMYVQEVSVDAGMKVLQTVTKSCTVQHALFVNQLDFDTRFNGGNGILLDINVRHNDIIWKLDIALVDEKDRQYELHYNNHIREQLTPDKRQAIMDIKTRATQTSRYRKHFWTYRTRGTWFYSNDIYKAVLDHDIQTYEEFCKFLEETRGFPPDEPSSWQEG